MEKNTLGFRTIESLIQKKDKFFVPSYQRGYKWTRTQVRELLEDIWEFRHEKKADNFYCLQPVVVTNNNGEWELIDGQQRLTTIYLILYCLNQRKAAKYQTILYSLRYDTRPGSEDFLKNIDESRKMENIDYFHFAEALDEIDKWLMTIDSQADIFGSLLRNDTKIIWYEVQTRSSSEVIDIFTRLNIGKIPLSDAELIKALFLRKKNFISADDEVAYLKQTQIAREWDEIEQTLRTDSFWYFITSDSFSYSSRIEFIFDTIIRRDPGTRADDHHTFYRYTELFKSETVENLWQQVKDVFTRFNEWYNDRELYHLIGFLAVCGHDIYSLLDLSKSEEKNIFSKKLKSIISNKIEKDIPSLSYENGNVRRVLLLFNVITALKSGNQALRFPFDQYRQENWDIEHVRAIKSQKPTVVHRKKAWVQAILEYFTGEEEIADQERKLDTLDEHVLPIVMPCIQLMKIAKWDDALFDEVYSKTLSFFKEDKEQPIDNNISNLVLLDAKTNRSYKNAVYPVKRKRIISNDNDGTFVLPCTKNVFLKSYSTNISDMMHWYDTDQLDYLNSIQNILSEYTQNA